MDFKEYQSYVSEGMSENYTLSSGLLGLIGEAGELCDVVKKSIIYTDKRLTEEQFKNKLIDELGDVMWQAFAVATLIGVPMTHVVEENVAKLNERHGNKKLDTTGGKR